MEGLPNFYGIGAQKAGTSWLYENIKLLPDFRLLPIKELHYFDRDPKYSSRSDLTKTYLSDRFNRNYAKKIIKTLIKSDNYHELSFYFKWFFGNYNDKWYESLYLKNSFFTGEITPSYSFLNIDDIKRMYAINPDAKLILLLRNPIERAWSHYKYQSRNKKKITIENEDPSKIIKFMNSDGQLLRSNYSRTIKNFTSVFTEQQLIIGFFDAIEDLPAQLITDIINFIGSDKTVQDVQKKCSLNKKVNVSKKTKIPDDVLNHLLEMYEEPIIKLSQYYGSYFKLWKYQYYGGLEPNNEELEPTITI